VQAPSSPPCNKKGSRVALPPDSDGRGRFGADCVRAPGDPDGSLRSGQDRHDATGGVVTRSYVTSLRKGRIENPGFEKLRAIAKAMGFPPELWLEDVENLRDVSGIRPSWFVDGEDKLTLLDEELAEALRDETACDVLREVARLPERERKIVLGMVRQFTEMGGASN
jgi:transcriptional regulator with XRE-family HTH domain